MLASTAPPIIVSTAVSLAARHSDAAFVYHCQDIYPEIALASGLVQQGRIERLAKRIDTATIRRTARVVTLSSDMAETINARLAPERAEISLINSFVASNAEPDVVDPVAADSSWVKPAGKKRVIFAGNLGNFQGLEALVDAANGR